MLSFDQTGGVSAGAAACRLGRVPDPRPQCPLDQLSAAAPDVAAFLGARPDLIDALYGDVAATLGDGFARMLQAAGAARYTTGDHLARVYRSYGRHKHLADAAFLLGRLPIGHAGRVYAGLAENALRSILAVCEAEFTAIHGRVRGGRHAVVALGKLGSRELTATSDLDLTLIYDFDCDEPISDGPQPLNGCQYYVRLTQRLIAALTCNFGDGPLFELDFRLRPWGQKGPIATHIATLTGYFASEAWTYEAMALTRARVLTGIDGFARRVAAALRDAIDTTAQRRDLRHDVAEMRRLVQRERASRRVWDLKCVAGGLMDIDFIVQGFALRHLGAIDARPTTDTAGMIAALSHARVLATPDARTLCEALALYQAALHLLRIAAVTDPRKMPRALAAILAQATGSPDLAALEARLRETQRAVRAIVESTVNAKPASLYRRAA
jgi:[glutamine synthetase] adenylyltransferase / [glutamine synthetase]-adenylyl-L-tyrosine phosphorylase